MQPHEMTAAEMIEQMRREMKDQIDPILKLLSDLEYRISEISSRIMTGDTTSGGGQS